MDLNSFKGKHGPMLIAEIGGNHEGNFEYAKKLAKLAISTDVDYVKFQLYTGDGLVSKLEGGDRNKHFKKFELSRDQHIYLAEMIREANIGYMASVWEPEMMDWIDPYLKLYKIGSGDLTAYPIIKSIVKKGKPIILSTGLSTENEVLETIGFIQSLDSKYKHPENLALLQCTSMYPIQDKDANLSVISRLKEKTGLTVGYSDHTEGNKALETAYAMGAEILEFHFTDSREGKVFRDHKVSLTPAEVAEIIHSFKLTDSLRGNNIKQALPVEIENGHVSSFRRAVYPSMDIKEGTVLTEKHIICLRPNHGIDAREYEKLIGKTTMVDLKAHQKMSWDYLK